MKILLLSKTTRHCKYIHKLVLKQFSQTKIIKGERGDSLPPIQWRGDLIISFLSPWIIPKDLLSKTKIAINFHPGPPEYPGIGSYNFAIYNQEKKFGVTCHYMVPKVDSGKIIKIVRFSMSKKETVNSLKRKSMKNLVELFLKIWENIILEKRFPETKEHWLRRPYTRKDLQALCQITEKMSKKEVDLRIRATYFVGAEDLPFFKLFNHKFIYHPS